MAFNWLKDLTLAQIARLHADGKLTDEMLTEAGLTDDVIAKVNDYVRQLAEADPNFRHGLREMLAVEWEREHGKQGDDADRA